jgi:hypothetical protein
MAAKLSTHRTPMGVGTGRLVATALQHKALRSDDRGAGGCYGMVN